MYISKISYYIICLNFKFHKLYIIWILDELETISVDNDNKIIAFKTKEDLLKYAHKNSIFFDEELTTYEVNDIQQWTINPINKFDRNEFLNFWNLCTDISESINIKFSGDEKGKLRNRIYDKLFDASGVCAAINSDTIFHNVEIIKLNEIMQNGLALLVDNLCVVENVELLT